MVANVYFPSTPDSGTGKVALLSPIPPCLYSVARTISHPLRRLSKLMFSTTGKVQSLTPCDGFMEISRLYLSKPPPNLLRVPLLFRIKTSFKVRPRRARVISCLFYGAFEAQNKNQYEERKPCLQYHSSTESPVYDINWTVLPPLARQQW